MMWVAVSSDGQMSKREMLTELQRARICPVLTYIENDQPIAPIFPTIEMALAFAKRNTPTSYSIGVMDVDDHDQDLLRKDGFALETMKWPKRKETQVHVLYLDRGFQSHGYGARNQVLNGLADDLDVDIRQLRLDDAANDSPHTVQQT